MGKNQQMIKLFVVLLFSTAFIFSFSHYGAKAYEKITNADGKFSDGTTIGALDISGKTEDEAKNLLEEKYVEWLKDSTIQLQYGEKTVSFDLKQFHLDSQQTIDSIKEGQKNPAFITVYKLQVEEQLEILFPQLKTTDIDLDKLTTSLYSTAALFESGSQSYDLHNDFLLADHIKKDAVLNSAVITMKEVPFALQTEIDNNPEIEISEGSTFSLLEFAKKQKIDDIDSLNIIATGIYQVILPSNFSIEERNIGSTLPAYSPLGYEAMVNLNKKADLVIVNPNKSKYMLKFHLDNNQLKVTLTGEELVYKYQISTKDEQKLAFKTIIQYSPLLLPGKSKIQTKGKKGQIVKVYREVFQGDQFLNSELISEDYYPPSYQIEIHGLAGSTPADTQTTNTTGNQDGSSTETNDPSNPAGNDSSTTTDNTQQNPNENDLWGKPNEEPK
ncbi:G5 domain-containing protein [Neobacillus sp. OS1-33]|uniref:G5 domain-containing protein n=1 Tax=Neobacillus sp. OS1-33 TaxID=3070683 RepID=UPI0027E01A6E|nr:G5 domain-containing protein [Neobacillus sp. OS1-33]WML25425.1 G5 domain-containing protein [Neobacillus sp. OS1-33]